MPLRILGLLSQKGGELGSEEFWGYLNIYIYYIYIYYLATQFSPIGSLDNYKYFAHWIILSEKYPCGLRSFWPWYVAIPPWARGGPCDPITSPAPTWSGPRGTWMIASRGISVPVGLLGLPPRPNDPARKWRADLSCKKCPICRTRNTGKARVEAYVQGFLEGKVTFSSTNIPSWYTTWVKLCQDTSHGTPQWPFIFVVDWVSIQYLWRHLEKECVCPSSKNVKPSNIC